MADNRNVYQRFLRQLSIILTVLFGIQFVGTLSLQSWIVTVRPAVNIPEMIVEAVLAILAGILSRLAVGHWKWGIPLLILTAVDFIALAIDLTSLTVKKVDNLIDISIFLTGLVLYLQILACKQERDWRRTCKAEPLALDLRVTGSGDLFDPMVMAPHLEINRDIAGAVDRFLDTAERAAPLELYIHSGEKISPLLRETMGEVLRENYRDEEVRVNRFLERHFGRAMCLILVSVTALQLLHRFSGRDSSGIVWTIVSNFAGFSLWQIGATFFESSEAKRQLQRIQIAKYAVIRFL